MEGQGGGTVKERSHVLELAVRNDGPHDTILWDPELEWGKLLPQLQPFAGVKVVGLEHHDSPVLQDPRIRFCQVVLAGWKGSGLDGNYWQEEKGKKKKKKKKKKEKVQKIWGKKEDHSMTTWAREGVHHEESHDFFSLKLRH